MTCFIPGCAQPTSSVWPPAGCAHHWLGLPAELQDRIRAARPASSGERASADYQAALAAARDWHQSHPPVEPPAATETPAVSGAADYAMALAHRITGEREE